ncbi:peroxidase, partial [Streptomyces sp. SID8455]|nr:peroxidase [Streptomyces sp. SID8455]
DPPGTHDRILDFSTAVTGTLFFAPHADFLDAPPPPPALIRTGDRPEPVPAPVRQEPVPAGSDHGSLRIGSLQESAQ